MKEEHEKELQTLEVSNITDSLNHSCCALLCYAMLSIVIVCAGEKEGRSRERTADIGGKQCFVVLFFH